MQELKERVREVTIGYVTELLGTFRELGIDFRTTQTVFMGGGAILVSEIIKVVWGTLQRGVILLLMILRQMLKDTNCSFR